MKVYLIETNTSEQGPPWAPVWHDEYEEYVSFRRHILASVREGGKPLADDWRPLPVHVAREPEWFRLLPADIVTPGSNEVLMFSERAVTVLGDMLRADGELLPLVCNEGKYHLFNPLRVVDAVDWEASYTVELGSIIDFQKFGFQQEKLRGLHIFKIPEHPLGYYFISEALKSAAEAAELRNNLVFRLVWDSDDPDYFDERYANSPGGWERVKRDFLSGERPVPPPPFVPAETTEEPLSEDARENVTGMAQAAVAMLNDLQSAELDATDSPDRLVEALLAGLEQLRAQGLEGEPREHRAIELGVLYGEQLVRAYGWRWAKIGGAHAVVAPDASLYLTPVGFIFGFLLEPGKDLTVILLFNMLAKPQPNAQAGAYQQVG